MKCRYQYRSKDGVKYTPWFESAYTGTNCVINKLKVEYECP